MSALSGIAATMPPTVNPVYSILNIFNSNPYFIGLMMFFLNLGGRFLGMEITKEQERFFQHPWVRRMLIFTVFFIATRNLWVAFWLTLFIVLIIGYIFNENSSLCIFGSTYAKRGSKCKAAGAGAGGSEGSASSNTGGLTPEEQEIYRRLHEKTQRFMSASQQKKSNDEDETDPMDVYMENMLALQH
jgi:hypothetical protein